MASFSKIYVLGREGGFQGAAGVNPVEMLILVGDSDRQWLEPRVLIDGIKPLGKLKAVVPEGPDHPDSLLDACIAFRSEAFEQCPSLKTVEGLLGNSEQLDLHLGPKNISAAWAQLREEAREKFQTLQIWQAELERVTL